MPNIRYVHTNIISKDWRRLAEFYIKTFGCQPKLPERDLKGEWLDGLTGLKGAHIRGVHLILPGYPAGGPTLEIFQYDQNVTNSNRRIHTEGFGHLAFAVDDVEACLDGVVTNGGTRLGTVVKSDVEGVGRLHVVYAKDPEGNILEIQRWD